MRVLVLGGTGFIGTRVVRALAALGHEVTVYHRGQSEPDLPRDIRHVRSELAAIPLVQFPEELLRAAHDVVIHMVPTGDGDTRAAVEAFRGRARRLIAISSGDVYAAYGQVIGTEARYPLGIGALLDEDSPLRGALYPYGPVAPSPWGGELHDYEKILVERAVLGDSELAGTVLRLPRVYGPGDREHTFVKWITEMLEGQPRIVLGESEAPWRWTHGYVENVAAAIALAAVDERAAGRVFNVGEADTPTVAERVRTLARIVGWAGEVAVVPDDRIPPGLRMPIAFVADVAYDTSRIRRELGYAEPVGYVESLRQTIAAVGS